MQKPLKRRIDKGKVSELMTLPIRREESAYSIVSGAAIKRVLFVVLCRIPFAIYGLVIGLLAILEKPIRL